MRGWMALLCTLMLAGASPGMDAGGTRGWGHGRLFHQGLSLYVRHARRLGLSPQQVRQLREIRYRFLRDTALLRTNMRIAWEQLMDLYQRPQLDLERIQRQMDQALSLTKQLGAAFTKALKGQNQVLTPQQQRRAARLRRQLCSPGLAGPPGTAPLKPRPPSP